MRALLWAVKEAPGDSAVPAPGRVSVPLADGVPHRFYEAVGYRPLGRRALRVDIVERLAQRAWKLSRAGPFAAGPELLSMAGCGPEEISGVLAALGYRAKSADGEVRYAPAPMRRRKGIQRRAGEDAAGTAASPFSRLRDPATRP